MVGFSDLSFLLGHLRKVEKAMAPFTDTKRSVGCQFLLFHPSPALLAYWRLEVKSWSRRKER